MQKAQLERLASDIRDAAVHIRPQMLKELLEKVEDKEVDAIVRLLEGNGTFDLVSILGVILRDYGQWMDSVTMHRRRSDNYAQMDLILEYLGVVIDSGTPESVNNIVKMGAYEKMLQFFNKYRRDPALDEWRRSDADGPRELRFLFDYPEVGWSDMHVLVDGRHAMMINLSEVWDPFPQIREWMRKVQCSHSTESVSIDCENYTAQLSFTPDPDDGEYGCFTMTDDSGADDGICVKVSREGLLQALERGIHDFRGELFRWIEDNEEFRSLREWEMHEPSHR